MQAVRGRDTAPELLLRHVLWSFGARGWRVHRKELPGKPDVAFGRARVAVFVDGAFWHGHPDYYWGQSGPFWDSKIARNRDRDARVSHELEAQGWQVLRIWDFEIERDLAGSVGRVTEALSDRRACRRPQPAEMDRMSSRRRL